MKAGCALRAGIKFFSIPNGPASLRVQTNSPRAQQAAAASPFPLARGCHGRMPSPRLPARVASQSKCDRYDEPAFDTLSVRMTSKASATFVDVTQLAPWSFKCPASLCMLVRDRPWSFADAQFVLVHQHVMICGRSGPFACYRAICCDSVATDGTRRDRKWPLALDQRAKRFP